ncbi:hypothetical protein AHAS_Ahas01G0119300 [Arachis hypogaea]
MLDQLLSATKKVKGQDEKASVSSKISMKNEVVENETALEMTKEYEHSQPSQTSLESVIEKYEEEMKKYWEEQQTSSMKVLLSQMLNVKEKVEEQESEEDNQENPHSSEAEKHMKEELMKQPIQKPLDEEITPTITQQPNIESKENTCIINISLCKTFMIHLSPTTTVLIVA